MVLVLSPASRADAQAERRTGALLGVSVNELGLQGSVDSVWRWGLYDSDSPLLSEGHAALGAAGHVSPSYGSLEAWGVVAPLSILDVRAGAQGNYYFGAFSSLLPFAGPDDDFSRDTRRDRSGEARAAYGLRLFVEPSVQLRLGRVEARSTFGYEWWKLEPVGTWVYEPRRDSLLSTDGQVLSRQGSLEEGDLM